MPEKYHCQEPGCDRVFDAEPGLRMHHSRVHGNLRGNPALDRARKRKPKTTELVLHSNGSTFRRLDSFLILEDSDGGIWLAERIR